MHPANPHAASRSWHAALYVFLIYVFVSGGDSQRHGWADVVGQILAIPTLAVAIWRIDGLPASRMRMYGIVAVAAVALVPWLQLLPLSQWLWDLAPAREALAQDLATVGVQDVATNWSLTPAATLRSGLSFLPAVALFAGVLSVDTSVQRRLLILCVALPLASLVLGFLQLGAPQDSLFNPYPEWAPAMGGTFANANHQGTAMLIAIGICLAFAVGAYDARDETTGKPRNPWPAIIAGVTLLLSLPLINSRATVVIGALILVAAPLGMAASALRRSGRRRVGAVALLVAAVLAAIGLSAALGWMKVDSVDEVRGIIRQTTIALGTMHLPWGSGIGSFVPIFQQALPEALFLPGYVNEAHNDYAQVWLEGGVLALVVAAFCIVVLANSIRVYLFTHYGDRRLLWAGMLSVFALLAHAGADYALRTPALMAIASVLVAVLVAQGARPAVSTIGRETESGQ